MDIGLTEIFLGVTAASLLPPALIGALKTLLQALPPAPSP